MQHIRRYDREELRAHYLRQSVPGAEVWANYVVNLWEYEHGVQELTSYPWNITIPMTEVCNARCTFCSSPLVSDPKASTVHEIHHFEEALRYAVRVSLQGLGEPLAHPHFETICTEVRRYLNPVAELEIITNGWLLSGHRWGLLKAMHIGHMQVSVNAATDQTHQIAMGSRPGIFEQVVRNIESVLTDRGWPRRLKVSMVITRYSLPEVTEFLDMFAQRHVRSFQFNALLPITTADWGFGRKDQYLDLWCGHLPNAADLVERAKKSIARYRRLGITITAAPEQWLLPVDRSRSQSYSAASSTLQRFPKEKAAPYLGVGDQRFLLEAHPQHAEIIDQEDSGVRFRGTTRSCRWAYLLRSPSLTLGAGAYSLILQLELSSGKMYAGILDVKSDDFLVQKRLSSGPNQIDFTLNEARKVEVILRQGEDNAPVLASFFSGQLSSWQKSTSPASARQKGVAKSLDGELVLPAVRQLGDPEPLTKGDRGKSEGEPESTTTSATLGPATVQTLAAASDTSNEGEKSSTAKAGRIFCPMVYHTLSVFHYSLDVSICCYMENAPGYERPNMRGKSLLAVYNDPAFQSVRRTLKTDPHLPVCDMCPYGNHRS